VLRLRTSYLFVLTLCLALLLLLSHTQAIKKKSSDPSHFHDCDSCVAAGFGWSWEEEECGAYLNTDCITHAEEQQDPHQHTQPTQQSSSNYDHVTTTDKDEYDDSSSSAATPVDDEDDEDEYVLDDDVDDDYESHGPKTFSWQDTEATTHIWRIVHAGDYDNLAQLLSRDPDLAKYRSADGRGALWWAYEYDQDAIIDLLIAAGADEQATDKFGNKPAAMRQRDL